jgi:dephospho-CoA kinase
VIRGEHGPVFVVVLTGGIAAGKTAVSRLFERLGATVIDTDVIARELVEPGQPLLSSIVGVFGREMLDAYGRLKRKKLREIIFADAEKRARLEAVMHPRIGEEALRRITRVSQPYCLLVIPLLVETDGKSIADRVLVVDADDAVRLRRLMERDGATRAEADAAFAAQAGRQERLEIADDIIDNSGGLASLEAQVATLHKRYLRMAKQARPAVDHSTPEG